MKSIKTFVVVALIVACDGGAPVEPTKPVQPVVVTSVDTLRPGQIAQIHGSGLKSLSTLTFDGVAATELVASSDNVAQFRVPTMRACETDMRIVKVSANGSAPIGAVVRVTPTVSLKPGESRILTEDDLKCLRLPAANEDYVLSAANLNIPAAEMETPRLLVNVRLLGTGHDIASTSASSAARTSLAPFFVRAVGAVEEPAMPLTITSKSNYSQAPTPFDPRYATAVVGDTLRFVDWFSGDTQICNRPVESVPSFQAQVVAISGQVVVVADLRHAAAAAFLDPAKLGWLREGAAMTDRLLLPTMRSLFDPAYQPPAGGGGRFFLMLGTMPSAFGSFTGFAYDGPLPNVNLASQASCPRASEMVVSTINADRLSQALYQNPRSVASLFIHEYAHSADFLTSGRGRILGILGEGLATLAQETASRIASGQSVNARHSNIGTDAPVPDAGALGMWGTQPELGPWQFNGRYGVNSRMLLFLRELAGEASVDHGRRPTVYQRLVSAQIDWLNRPAVIAHITSVLSISYSELIDRHTLASVTAGLIDAGVAHDLPRYTSWDHSQRAVLSGPRSDGFPGNRDRFSTGDHALTAADGGHAAIYLMGNGPRGISIELISIAPTARIVRLTRLR